MSENIVEAIIGAAVLAVAAFFLLFVSQQTGYATGGGDYPLTAKFRSAEGIVVGSDVRLAGVKIGSVTSMTLDPVTFQAETGLSLVAGVEIPDDSQAGVASEGLLGGAFIQIEPGGSDIALGPGEEILNTQSAVSFIDLLVRFAAGSGSGGGGEAQ